MRPSKEEPRAFAADATQTIQCPPKPSKVRIGASTPEHDRLAARDRRAETFETERVPPARQALSGIPGSAQLLVTNRVDIAWATRESVVRTVDACSLRTGVEQQPLADTHDTRCVASSNEGGIGGESMG